MSPTDPQQNNSYPSPVDSATRQPLAVQPAVSADTRLLGGDDHRNAVEFALDQALARPPAVTIPPAFAARVARLALEQPLPARSAWLGWGPRLALGSGALLTVALFALAPYTVPSLANPRFDAELILLTELSGLVLFANRLLPRR